MNDGCTTSWGGNLLFFWRFKKSRIVPLFFWRERLKERIVYVFETFCFFASALLGGIDLRFYEAAAAAAGSGGRHLILSFLEKEGEREKEKARERE